MNPKGTHQYTVATLSYVELQYTPASFKIRKEAVE